MGSTGVSRMPPIEMFGPGQPPHEEVYSPPEKGFHGGILQERAERMREDESDGALSNLPIIGALFNGLFR